jgi:hypothetical protein
MMTVRIPRVLRVRLHNNRHIRAMREEIGSRVRHSAIGKIRRVVLMGRRKGVSLTLVLLSRMRRSWLHRHVVGGMVGRRLSGFVHARDGGILSVNQGRVTHRAHERRGGRCTPGRGDPGE